MGESTSYRLRMASQVSDEALLAVGAAFGDRRFAAAEASAVRAAAHEGQLSLDTGPLPVGLALELANDVLAALVGASRPLSFAVEEAPVDEWPGTLCRFDPDLGMHTVQVDAWGQPILSQPILVKGLDQLPPAAFAQMVRQRLGIAWAGC